MRFVPSSIFGLAIATLMLSSGAASAQTFRCEVIHDRTRINGESVVTRSTGFRTMAGTAITVTQTTNRCLIVEFSAQINAGGAIELRLIRDGLPVGFPSLVNVVTLDRSDNRTIRFIVPPNADNIGTHIYALEFRSEDGEVVGLSRSMTTVYYPE